MEQLLQQLLALEEERSRFSGGYHATELIKQSDALQIPILRELGIVPNVLWLGNGVYYFRIERVTALFGIQLRKQGTLLELFTSTPFVASEVFLSQAELQVFSIATYTVYDYTYGANGGVQLEVTFTGYLQPLIAQMLRVDWQKISKIRLHPLSHWRSHYFNLDMEY